MREVWEAWRIKDSHSGRLGEGREVLVTKFWFFFFFFFFFFFWGGGGGGLEGREKKKKKEKNIK